MLCTAFAFTDIYATEFVIPHFVVDILVDVKWYMFDCRHRITMVSTVEYLQELFVMIKSSGAH